MPQIFRPALRAIPAVEQCCLTKLDRRFVILVQMLLTLISLNIIGAYSMLFAGVVLSAGGASLFMLRGDVWAFALAKVTALVFIGIYSLDLLAHIPRMPILPLSHEAMTTTLWISKILGVWLSGIMLANLGPVPLRVIFHP